MANRQIHETRLGKVKAANWRNEKSRRDSIEPLRLLNVPGGIRTCDLRFRKPTLYPAELRGLDLLSAVCCLRVFSLNFWPRGMVWVSSLLLFSAGG